MRHAGASPWFCATEFDLTADAAGHKGLFMPLGDSIPSEARWLEALEAGCAPRVVLRATHESALDYCSLADLERFALDLA